jgi:hypothetical protein
MKVMINRRTWNSGDRFEMGGGRLYAPGHAHWVAGDMPSNYCCLGFLGSFCGATDDEMTDVGLPSETIYPDSPIAWPDALFERPSQAGGFDSWEAVFAELNDYSKTDIDDATREAWIAEGFKTVLGVKVEFVGDYGDGT